MRHVLIATLALACASSSPKPTTTAPAATSSSGASAAPAAGTTTFHAELSSQKEVPQPTLDPRGGHPAGTATFTANGSTLTYKINVTGLSSPYTAAHIHVGAEGVAGPAIVMLNLNGGSQGDASGEGTIDTSAIKAKRPDGSPASMDDIIAEMKKGNTYVNVHTQNNKAGECRGQIQPG